MKHARKFLFFVLVTFSFGIIIYSCAKKEDKAIESSNSRQVKELAEYMHIMQIFTHKLLLSIDSKNKKLSAFYLHELEETTEDIIENITEYHGFPVSDLSRTMLLPAIEEMEDEITSGDWGKIRQKSRVLIGSCNSCHINTDHEFIVIPEETETNLYLQRF